MFNDCYSYDVKVLYSVGPEDEDPDELKDVFSVTTEEDTEEAVDEAVMDYLIRKWSDEAIINIHNIIYL